MSMFQNDLQGDLLMSLAENELLIPDLEKEALRQASLAATTGLNGTTDDVSSPPQASRADLLVGLAGDEPMSAADLDRVALRQVSLAAATGLNATTSISPLPQVSQAAARLAGGPRLAGGALFAVLAVAALFALGCIMWFLGSLDRKSASPPQAKEKKRVGRSRHALGSASSLGVPEGKKRAPPGSAASLASARSHASRATRDSYAGRLLSARVRGRDAGGSLNGKGALGIGTTPGSTPATKIFTFDGDRASVNGAQRISRAPCARSPQAGDCRFTVPVDTLVEVAEEGGFDITDVGSGLVLQASMRRDDQGHRVLQMFQGLPRVAQRPCMTVGPPKPGSPSDQDSLDISGADGQMLGNLVLQCTGSFLVSARGQPLLVIEGNEADLDLHISSARDGGIVGAVCCNDANFSGQEHVEFRVMSGTDPVLVVSCILAVLFLCGDDDEAVSCN